MNLIDSELRALPSYFRNIKFCDQHPDEGVCFDIYRSPDIKNRFKHWSSKNTLQRMDEAHVDFGLISGLAFRDTGLQDLSNNYIETSISENPRKLIGFYIMRNESPKAMIKTIETLDRETFAGVEFIPKWTGIDICDAQYKIVFNCLAELNIPVKVYTSHPTQKFSGNTVFQTLSLIQEYKNNLFIIPHLGGLLPLYSVNEGWELLFEHCLFLSSVSSSMKMVQFCCEALPHNIAFATDYPFNHDLSICNSLKKIMDLNLDKDVRPLLHSINITNFLSRTGSCIPI